MKLIISGATGFVGRALKNSLTHNGHTIHELAHNKQFNTSFVENFDCLIHLAGRAHVMHEHEAESESYKIYREINVDYTLKLANLAQALGIKRFIFLSSIKVNGEQTTRPFTEKNTPSPQNAYGQTKLEAEVLLEDFCAANQMELVIIRPPLIYGPRAKANLKALIQLCSKPIPLPFGNVKNKRSLISLENLNNFIELCCHHPLAANQTFLVSDDHDVSTTELINTIRTSLGKKPCQIPVPEKLLSMAFNIVGKHHLNDRLLNNLQLDISKAKKLLNWRPVISFEEGIKRTVSEYAG